MANVVLKNVYKYYDKNPTPAVSDFNLEIKDCEFVVFVGPSGCGKSTTLRMIAGLEDISDGEIYIDGKLVNDEEPKNRDIAMVFQNYALYPHMTIYNNMSFGLKFQRIEDIKKDKNGNPILDKNGQVIHIKRKFTKNEIDEKVRNAAEILEISDYLNRKPAELSGGQKQRVAIGRAIVRNPKVFLMDEPLSNLDAKLRNQMRSELIDLHNKLNTTFIYVTHDQIEAMTLGDRIVIMKDGFIQQVGTPKELFDHPANLFVASFIGTPQMNFFEADLIKNKDAYEIAFLNKTFKLHKDIIEKLNKVNCPTKKVMVGIRPEHMKIADKKEKNNIVIKGDVSISEMTGSEFNIHINFSSNMAIVRIPIISLTEEEQERIKAKGSLDIAFIDNCLHLFDFETKKSLL